MILRSPLERKALADLQALAAEARPCELVLLSGKLHGPARHEILRAAVDFGARLIVMGTHGSAGLGRIALGSVTVHIVRHSPIPVLAIPRPTTH